MKTSKYLKKRFKKGITLIELMIVIGIIGMLMTTIYLMIGGSDVDRKTALFQMQADRIQIETALFRFKQQYGRYPTSDEGLEALVAPPTDDAGNTPMAFLNNKEHIIDPWKNIYAYEVDDSNKYMLQSFGADGEPGGEGENEDFDLQNLPQN